MELVLKSRMGCGIPIQVFKDRTEFKEKYILSRSKKIVKQIVIRESWCKGCAICVDVCPKNVLAMNHLKAAVVNLQNCIVCGRCEANCPDFCLEVVFEESKDE